MIRGIKNKINIKKLFICLSCCALMLVGFSGCYLLHKEAYDSLYVNLSNNNLQGTRDVLNENRTLDLSDIGHSEYTDFNSHDKTALGIAVYDADESVVSELINAGAPVNNGEEWTYLTGLIIEGSMELIREIIDFGADVNPKGDDTPLSWLMHGINPGMDDGIERMELLVENGATFSKEDVYACLTENQFGIMYISTLAEMTDIDEWGLSTEMKYAITGQSKKLQEEISSDRGYSQTLILCAASYCDADTLKKLKENGSNLNFETSDLDMSPLQVAAMCGNYSTVEYLLKEGLDPKMVTGSDGWYTTEELNATSYAAISGNKDVMNLILSNGGKLQTKWSNSTWDAILDYGNENSIDCVLNAGYEPTEEDIFCLYGSANNAVFSSLDRYDFSIVDETTDGDGEACYVLELADEKRMEELLDEGYDLTITTEITQKTIEWRNIDLLEQCIKKGKNLDLEELLGEAVIIGDMDSVELLIESGADPNKMLPDSGAGYEQTVMHEAAWCQSKTIMKYLIDHGGDITVKNEKGETPYDVAKESQNTKEILEMLEVE